jgi:hypothetical protein
MRKSVRLIWIAQLAALSVAFGSELAKDRATLRGLAGVFVVVEEMDSDLKLVLSSEDVQVRVEKQLRAYGIPLIPTTAEFVATPNSAVLVRAEPGRLP